MLFIYNISKDFIFRTYKNSAVLGRNRIFPCLQMLQEIGNINSDSFLKITKIAPEWQITIDRKIVIETTTGVNHKHKDTCQL